MTDLSNIRLAGIDLDGTLLNDSKQLCEGTEAVFAAAASRGVQLVPITGRPFAGIPACVRALPEIEYYICSNGAQIIDAKTEKALCSFTIPNAKCRRIMGALRALDCAFEPFANGWGYTEQAIYQRYMQQFSGTPLEEYITSSRRIIDCVESVFDNGETEADEFFVNCPDGAVRERLIAAMDRIGGLQYCYLGDRFVEITRKGTDKGEALAALCCRLGIDIAETIAFGDGENDLLFLKKAGIAVAMENAHPAVKSIADIITSSNNDNGVCAIIKALRAKPARDGKDSL